MKIIILNGSMRKNGATAAILKEMYSELNQYEDTSVEYINISDLTIHYCIGCCKCYETGKCVFQDDGEILSKKISDADGVIIGSPTYASNVSGPMKVFIDRGHFVFEQLLQNQYAISVITYENYGGKAASKILTKLLSYSGANITKKLALKIPFSSTSNYSTRLNDSSNKYANKLYKDISIRKKYPLQQLARILIFKGGILPFTKKKGSKYQGLLDLYETKKLL